MTSALDTIRYHSGVAGEEVAALIDELEANVARYEQAEELRRTNGTIVEAELREQVAALTKDAERYRWLRSSSTGPSQIWELLSDDCQPPILTLKSMGDLDAAIDKAMQEDKP